MFKRGKYVVNKTVSKLIPWEKTKEKYLDTSYEYVDATVTDRKQCKRGDKHNIDTYSERMKSARTLSKIGNVVNVIPPPRPTNTERYDVLNKWLCLKPALEISLASAVLAVDYHKFPCTDYAPDEAVSYLETIQQERPKEDGYYPSLASAPSSSTVRRNSYLPSELPDYNPDYNRDYLEVEVTETKDI